MIGTFLKINPDNPQIRKIEKAVKILSKGGIIIYPTDTVYGIGCSLYSAKAIQTLLRIKGVETNKMNLSFICYDLSDVSNYIKPIGDLVFKLMKKTLPGPYTYILESNTKISKLLNVKKKQVGVRVPNHQIPRTLVSLLGNPIVNTSLKDDDDLIEYTTDPELIYEKYKNQVDLVIDSGYGNNIPSTVVDCTGDELTIVREGLGDIKYLL